MLRFSFYLRCSLIEIDCVIGLSYIRDILFKNKEIIQIPHFFVYRGNEDIRKKITVKRL